MPGRDPLTIAVLVADDAPIFETSVPLAVFGVDRSAAGVPRFRVLPFTVHNRHSMIRSTAGLGIVVPYGLEAIDSASIVVVPSWCDPEQAPSRKLVRRLAEAHHDGARIVGLCLGAFVLASAGLLDNRQATTHWLCAPALAKHYPKVSVDRGVLYVEDDGVLTSAGSTAGIDACLHIVRQDHGAAVAATIARRMVVPPHRSGGQAQYIGQPVPDGDAEHPVIEVATWALNHLNERIETADLAARAFMSRRTFDRVFRQLMGTSPKQWVMHQRILRAQHLLETTNLPIDAVAREAGFAVGSALRPHFRSMIGAAPGTYRDAFRHTAADEATDERLSHEDR